MDLNSTILVEDLAELCTSSRILSDYKTLTLNRIEIAEEHKAAQQYEASILLVPGDQITRIQVPSDCAVVLYDYENSDASLDSFPNNDLILLQPDTSLGTALSAIGGIFAHYNNWLKQLDEILDRNGSVDEMVEASMPVFQSNTMIHDDSFRVICYKLYGNNQSANQFAGLGKGGFFTKEQIRLLKQSFRNNTGMAKPFLAKGPHANEWLDGRKDLSINVHLPGGYTVRINMSRGDGKTDVPDKLFPLIQQFANYIRYAYLIYPPNIADNRHAMLTECMTRLYNGEHVPREELGQAASELGWDYHDDLILTSLIIPLDKDRKRANLATQPLISIANRVMTTFKEMVSLYPGNTLCMLFNYSKSGLTMKEVKKRFDKVAKEDNLLIAYAMPNDGLRHSKFGYEQIKSIIKFALERRQKAGAYLVEDLSLDFAYHCIEQEIRPFSLVPLGLVMLVDHDNKKSSELYPTLRAYIECDCSPAKATKRLFIERSTFYYRLNQALEILDMDLDDPEVKLKLMIAFRILDRESEDTIRML